MDYINPVAYEEPEEPDIKPKNKVALDE